MTVSAYGMCLANELQFCATEVQCQSLKRKSLTSTAHPSRIQLVSYHDGYDRCPGSTVQRICAAILARKMVVQ